MENVWKKRAPKENDNKIFFFLINLQLSKAKMHFWVSWGNLRKSSLHDVVIVSLKQSKV